MLVEAAAAILISIITTLSKLPHTVFVRSVGYGYFLEFILD